MNKSTKLEKSFAKVACSACKYVGRRFEFHKGRDASAMIGTCPQCRSEVTI